MKKLLVLLFVLTVAIVSSIALHSSSPKDRPNIVLVIIDCWRYDRFSPEVTPKLWELSKQGTVFDNYYVNAGFTRGSMAAIFSSQYLQFTPDTSWKWNFQMGLSRFYSGRAQLNEEGQEMFPEKLLSFPEYLKHNGYTTIGVTPNGHVGRMAGYGPKQWTSFSEITAQYAPKIVTEATKQVRLAEAPFFMYVHFNDMHWPYNRPNIDDETLELLREYRSTRALEDWETEEAALARRRDLTPLALKTYDDAGRVVDAELSRLLKEIDLTKSIVIITGDHGETFNDEDFELLEHQGYLPEEVVHVPFIVVGKGIKKASSAELAHSLDIYPTVVNLAGLSVPREVKGQDLFSPEHDLKATFASTPREDAHITLEKIERTPPVHPPSKQEVMDSLRALGYLD